jgi:hypothetical protein
MQIARMYNNCMNKSVIMFFTIVFSLIGGYLPVLFGDSIFSLWGILGGFVGGILGIWIGAVVSKRFF